METGPNLPISGPPLRDLSSPIELLDRNDFNNNPNNQGHARFESSDSAASLGHVFNQSTHHHHQNFHHSHLPSGPQPAPPSVQQQHQQPQSAQIPQQSFAAEQAAHPVGSSYRCAGSGTRFGQDSGFSKRKQSIIGNFKNAWRGTIIN